MLANFLPLLVSQVHLLAKLLATANPARLASPIRRLVFALFSLGFDRRASTLNDETSLLVLLAATGLGLKWFLLAWSLLAVLL